MINANQMKKAIYAFALGLVAIGLGSKAADATTTTTTTFAVSATVQATCLVSASPMSFGTYTGALVTTTSTVSVTCTNTTPYNVGLDAGGASGATVTTRKMTNSTATLAYSLFSDSGHTTNWGSTVNTDTVGGVGSGSSQALTVYGQAAAGQYVTPGSYTDTITATVTY